MIRLPAYYLRQQTIAGATLPAFRKQPPQMRALDVQTRRLEKSPGVTRIILKDRELSETESSEVNGANELSEIAPEVTPTSPAEQEQEIVGDLDRGLTETSKMLGQLSAWMQERGSQKS